MLKHLREENNDKNLLEQGFTLIELLIVIVILGILAAVVVFAVGGISDRGEGSACATESRTFQTAIEAYRAKNDNALPAGGVDETAVATSLQGAGLLSSANLGYASGSPSWSVDAAGVVTAGAGCVGS